MLLIAEHLVWRKIAAPADRHILVCSADHLHSSLLGDSLAERSFLRCGSQPKALPFRYYQTWKQTMQTACNLVTASARGTKANISGKGTRWKVPSRPATRTILPLGNVQRCQDMRNSWIVDLLAISSHQVTTSGKNWPSSIPITSNSLGVVVYHTHVVGNGVNHQVSKKLPCHFLQFREPISRNCRENLWHYVIYIWFLFNPLKCTCPQCVAMPVSS